MKRASRFVLTCVVALSTTTAWPIAQQPQARLRVGGNVPRPIELTRDDIAQMPHQSVEASAHEQQGRYDGVLLRDILQRAGVPMGEALRGPALATYVVVTAADAYRAVFALAELDAAFTDRVVLLADKRNGEPLPANAAPFQIIVPGEKRPARWVRQVVSIEVLTAPAIK